MMFRETGDKAYLDFAEKAADFAIDNGNMPEDGVPYWDFGAPGEERDSSAAAVMASGLLELSTFAKGAKGEKYRAFAVKQLLALSSPEYFSEGDEIGHFILKHGVGYKPAGQEIDTPLNYGDYYYLEALLRFRRLSRRGALQRRRDFSRAEGTCAAKAAPPLFATDEEFGETRERLSESEIGAEGLRKLIEEADGYLGVAPVERVMEGRRLLAVSREALTRIGKLAFAWKMTGERKYAERAAEEARAVCRFSDWNPAHFLDTAEMTLAVAIARAWLDDALTDEDKRLFSEAILLKGLTTGDGKTLSGDRETNPDTNWNAVCNGGLCAGAAVVRDEYPEVAEAVLRRARERLPRGLAEYEGGNFPKRLEAASPCSRRSMRPSQSRFCRGSSTMACRNFLRRRGLPSRRTTPI